VAGVKDCLSCPDYAHRSHGEIVTVFSRKSAHISSLFVLVPFAQSSDCTLSPSRYSKSDVSIPLVYVLSLSARESKSNTSATEMNTWDDFKTLAMKNAMHNIFD
jgi:hypothetical protein